MKKGDWVNTPRFLKVHIEKVFRSQANALKQGFTEPTDFRNSEYGILGKSTGFNMMVFAAYKK